MSDLSCKSGASFESLRLACPAVVHRGLVRHGIVGLHLCEGWSYKKTSNLAGIRTTFLRFCLVSGKQREPKKTTN